MDRHSSKKFYDIVVNELLKKKFIKKDKTYVFSHWDYKTPRICLFFCEEKDINKNPIYDGITLFCIQLFYQHYNGYENTLNLVYEDFDKVENLETK